MHLTLQTDYSIRILLYLATAPTEVNSVSTIAGAFGISHNHLVKIARQLTQLGYVHAVRGRTGGLKLGMRAEEINIGEVVRKMEPHLNFAECFASEHDCVIARHCTLQRALVDAGKAFFDTLDAYSLASLIQSPALRQELIQLGSRPARVSPGIQ